MTTRSRLARLEARQSPAPEADPVATWTFQLCEGSALLAAINRAGVTRARRRHLLAHPDDHLHFDPPDLRTTGLRVEYADLRRRVEHASFTEGDGFIEAVEDWITEADRLGWPRPRSGSDRVVPDVEAFRLTWRSQRQVNDGNRSGRYGAAWRAANPTWRPDMTDDEHLAWDLGRISAAIREGRF